MSEELPARKWVSLVLSDGTQLQHFWDSGTDLHWQLDAPVEVVEVRILDQPEGPAPRLAASLFTSPPGDH